LGWYGAFLLFLGSVGAVVQPGQKEGATRALHHRHLS
jgi:energy-converting hydrogenase Eha subunit E